MQKLSSPFDLIKKAVNLFAKKENFIYLIQVYSPVAFFSLLSLAQTYLPASIKSSNSVWWISGVVLLQILYVLTTVFVTASGIVALGKVVGGGELSVKKTFKTAWKRLWKFSILSLLVFLIVFGGGLLLVIPGIVFGVWYSFSIFIFMEGEGVLVSLGRSRNLVKGRFWKILGRLIIFGAFTAVVQIILSAIPYGVGSIVAGLCGGLFILPLYLLYRELSV